MSLGGFANRILYVDLTSGRIEKRALDPKTAEKFVGGLGLCVKLASDHIQPGTDPLASDNPIVLGAGPLVGTNVPASSRVYGVTKLPASGAVGWCGAGGGRFGINLKNAGYDHIVIVGRAAQPVYLKIRDNEVSLCEAGFLWGQGVEAASEALWGKEGRGTGIIAIGQAGENQVCFSLAYIDRQATLGRGGFGAVMGSKNLKAVVVQGSGGIGVADPKRYKLLVGGLLKRIREYPQLKDWQTFGLLKSMPLIDPEAYFKFKKRRLACVSCPIGDKDLIEIPEGEFKGLRRCSTSAANLLTPFIYGFNDYYQAIKCITTLDDYGLDMFEFFGIMAFAKKLRDQGLISGGDTVPEIRLDSLASMEAWAGMISRAEGLGAILGRGFKGLLAAFGEETKSQAPPLIKGMVPYVGPRGPVLWDLFGTQELGQVLDPRGPHVGAGGSPTYFSRRPLEAFPSHLDRMGASQEAIERILPGLKSGVQDLRIGRLLKYSQRWFSILGCLGVCARGQVNRFYSAKLCTELYQAVTGLETDLEGLRKGADRVWTMLRLANLREDFSRSDDSLPRQWFEEPGFKDYVTGQPARPEDLEKMIEDYYDEQGWDPETGVPTERCLNDLDLP